ncbi:hypothetical protein BC628DRAFT_1409914 [Trametes gibbosa]|nr:hypothetical protein BC628DRAFT_1409914 [Trametes gibbosa]
MAEVAGSDILSELLIAQMLEDDMRQLENARTAEEIQLSDALRSSALAAGQNPRTYQVGSPYRSDQDVAVESFICEVIANKDAVFAQALQHTEEKNIIASFQYAQKLAAAEKKSALDAEFAKRLQEAIDNGENDTDMRDAESVLGQHAIEEIVAEDLNDKGKGKGKATYNLPPPYYQVATNTEECARQDPYPICGICMEPFQATYSPAAAARSANSSSCLQFGTHLPCPKLHAYCISCLNGYIHSKLDPEGEGVGNPNMVVFPIRCPECPVSEWPAGIPDTIAERVLSDKGLVLWHHQKLLDNLPRHYCPNPRCSALVQLDEDSDDPQAICPACNLVICVPCRTVWHHELTCEEYQALPLDDRDPEDQKALRLMKANIYRWAYIPAENWRRCPKCSFIVELTHGCNHITCRCKTEFCFKCGSIWDVQNKRCSRVPSCELWDEDMLLEERERMREIQHAQRQPPRIALHRGIEAPPAYRHHVPIPVPYHLQGRRKDGDLRWMEEQDVLCTRHWFTAQMINSLTCQYCFTKLNSLADLRYHLTHVRRHGVYACCGRFSKREEDYERHLNAPNARFGGHAYQVRRNQP